MTPLEACWWPHERIGEAIEALALAAGLAAPKGGSAPPVSEAPRADARANIETVSVDVEASRLAALLLSAGPATIEHELSGERGFFALIRNTRGRVILLDPEVRPRAVSVSDIRDTLVAPVEAPLRASVKPLLSLAAIPEGRREAVADALVAERLAAVRIDGITLLRTPASAPIRKQLRAIGAKRFLIAVAGGAALLYILEILGWKLIGRGVLAGQVDRGWLTAWGLVLLTMIATGIAVAWCESRLAIGMARVLKSRLLAGALALRPDLVRRGGIGQLIGRVIEAQALESLAFDGGLSGLLGVIELGLATWVLSQGASPLAHGGLIALWAVAIAWLGRRYYRRLAAWSGERLARTNELIEGMVGHRTRLAQEPAGRREAHDDDALQRYLDVSRRLDSAGLFGVTAPASAWLVAGIALLMPVVATEVPSPTALAITLGGLLLAQRGFAKIAGGLSSLSRAQVAWNQVKPIFAATLPAMPAIGVAATPAAPDGPVIDAESVTFRYPLSDLSVIDRADLSIARGDRILLEGVSGGGKSTLAALLTGLERPQSGLLLLGGLDRATLGDEWHRLATSAPQFHDNHILSGTMAFNLLMGRNWPPSAADLREAEVLCDALGLGDLLRRMPGGLDQRVGETGWQLSHGERGRIFLARALLQDAQFTVMDESFAALDPETQRRALQATLDRAETLLIVAHP